MAGKRSSSGPTVPTARALAALERAQQVGDDMDDAPAAPAEDFPEDLFASVRRLANSQMESHRQMVAMLAAVEELIDERGLQRIPSAYFAALMNLVDANTIQTTDDKTVMAAMHLLAVVFPRLPFAVLRAKFSNITAVLSACFKHKNENQPVIRSALDCLNVTLKAQDTATWSLTSTHEKLRWLVSFILDIRPKLRKKAHDCLRTLFALPAPINTIALNETAKVCQKVLEQQTSSSDVTATLHAVVFLKEALVSLAKPAQEAIIKQLLRLTNLGHSHLLYWIYETFSAMFEKLAGPIKEDQDNHDDEDEEHDHSAMATASGSKSALLTTSLYGAPMTPLSASSVATLLSKLNEIRPDKNDVQLVVAWLAAEANGHRLLAQLDGLVCLQRVPSVFGLVVPLFTSDKQQVTSATASCLKYLLRHSLGPCLASAGEMTSAKDREALALLSKSLERCLSYTYQPQWTLTLPVVATAFDILGPLASPLLDGTVVIIDDVYRDSFDATSPPVYEGALVTCLKSAARAIGIKRFLELLPLNILAQPPVVSRPWLLALLRDAIAKGSPLSYFANNFLPLIKNMQATRQKGASVESKQLHVLILQAWALLPGFASAPGDIQQAFPLLAREIGTTLTNEPDARPSLCIALQTLIESLSKPSAPPGDRNVIAGFAKNFMPILFNIFGATAPDRRDFILDTIRSYISITDKQLVNSFFKTVMTKLLEASTSSATHDAKQQQAQRHTMLDLSFAMTPTLDQSNWNILARAIMPLLQDDDAIVQKKAYRCLYLLCEVHGSDVTAAIANASGVTLSDNSGSFAGILPVLLDATLAASASAKRERLRLIGLLVNSLNASECIEHVPTLLPEVMMGTKEVNEKARLASFDLLLTLARRMNELDGDGEIASLKEFLKMVLAGIGGTTSHMISASVSSLARILFEFHASLSPEDIDALLKTATLLLRSPAREVVKAAIGFIKVAIVVLADQEIGSHLPDLIEGMLVWAAPHKLRFKANLKYIFQRLLRKFGDEIITDLVPADHQRFIQNLKKQIDRSKRKKQGGGEEEEAKDAASVASTKVSKARSRMTSAKDDDDVSEEDYDSDEDLPRMLRQQLGLSKSSKQQAGTWIRESGKDDDDDDVDDTKMAVDGDDEDGDADPVDFLDRSIVTRVSSSRPVEKRGSNSTKRSRQKEVEIAPDGRMIFRDDEDADEEEYKQQRKHGQQMTAIKKKTKGSKYDQLMAEDEDEDDEQLAPKRGKSTTGSSLFLDEEDNANANDDAMDVDDDRKTSRSALSAKSAKSSGKEKLVYEPRGRYRATNKRSNGAGPKAFLGEEYKAKKAGGDIKRKGKPDPYAYVPLAASTLTNRKKNKNKDNNSNAGAVRDILKSRQRGPSLNRKQKKAAAKASTRLKK